MKSFGAKMPILFGLYNMLGKAEESCSDRYDRYPCGIETDSQGPSPDSRRVIRGLGCGISAGSRRAPDRNAHLIPTTSILAGASAYRGKHANLRCSSAFRLHSEG